ncbi:MAG: DedA family protein [Alphaproteobacteria bacterium]
MESLFLDAVAPFTRFVETHAHWAGPVVFAICFLESLALVSAIVPATVLLIGIGSLATAGVLDLATLSAWGIVGAGLGFWASYEGGRRYARQIEALPWLARRPQLLAKGHGFFERWGAMAVFIGRFVGPARVVVPMMAGTMGVEGRRFHLANWASAVIWAPMLLAPTAIAAWLTAWLESLPPGLRTTVSLSIVAAIVIGLRALRSRG